MTYVGLMALTVLIVLGAATDGLDGDPARLQQCPRREDSPVRAREAVCSAQPVRRTAGVRASAAAAVGCRIKASGRLVITAGSRGRGAPLSVAQASSPYRVRGHAPQARGALGAPLKSVEKVVTTLVEGSG